MASFSGRMMNFLSRRLPGLGRRGTRRQVLQFRSSGGRKGSKLLGKPVFLLDVVGRKSGESRPVMLMLIRREDEIIVVGSNGGNPTTPNWYKNLVAAGRAHVEVDDQRWAVDVRELEEGTEREECWGLATAGYADFAAYQELTDRRIPVAVLARRD
jgi:F420H(2)-dependent quinone reductase